MNELFQFLDGLSARLLMMDPSKLIVVLCIAMGYGLKLLTMFPNRLIPVVCLGLPMALYPMMNWTGLEMRKVTTDVVVAFILACVGWAAHYFVLRRLVDSRIFGGQDDAVKDSNNNQPKA